MPSGVVDFWAKKPTCEPRWRLPPQLDQNWTHSFSAPIVWAKCQPLKPTGMHNNTTTNETTTTTSSSILSIMRRGTWNPFLSHFTFLCTLFAPEPLVLDTLEWAGHVAVHGLQLWVLSIPHVRAL